MTRARPRQPSDPWLRRHAGVAIAVLSAVAVGALVIGDLDRVAPGTLSTVHGAHPDLAGDRSCAQCHGGWFSDMTQSCLQCHDDIEAQRVDGEGLHGRSSQAASAACARCHSEHHGASFALVNRQSFVAAGFDGREGFDHHSVGFAMGGAHQELECAACHAHADTAVLPAGAQRYTGLDATCASCHEDPHQGRMHRDCAACHTQAAFTEHRAAGHDRHLRLAGAHAALDCRTCHAAGSAHALERAENVGTPRRCDDCHASPHTQPFAEAAAAQHGGPAGNACADCHRHEHHDWREAERLTPAQHAATGFALAGPHQDVDCARCHAPDAADFATRHPGRTADDCHRCHADPHAGQFAGSRFQTGADAGRHCRACHDRDHFAPPAFDRERHAGAALPLDGAHQDLACADCHTADGDGVRRFAGTSTRCADCHRDAHGGQFDRFDAAIDRPPHGRCAHCHTTHGFAHPALREGFDHGAWTGFAVGGAHQQAGCESCHPRSATPDASGRTLGRVADHFGAFEGCHSCHRDPHRGGFDGPGLPATVEGRADCARCHADSSFRALPHGFDHGQWTGFALTGAHAQAACSTCHAPMVPADAHGRTWHRARGTACADCHTDPHGGQFDDAAGRTDCQRCHDPATAFAASRFDHERDAAFALGAQHRALDCAACHLADGQGNDGVIRYRPIAHQCTDCHREHYDPLRRRRRRQP